MKVIRFWFCLLLCSSFFFACETSQRQVRSGRLDSTTLTEARTALVIRTDYVYPSDPSWENRFLAQMAGPGDRMGLKTEYLDPLYQKHGMMLYRQLGQIILKELAGPGMKPFGLDKSTVFFSHDFPVHNPEWMFKVALPSHDYRALGKEGYTHVLIVGFNNSIQPSEDQRMLFFGINAVLLDIQGLTGNETRSELNARSNWQWWIGQTPSTKWTNFDTVNPTYRPGSNDAYLIKWTQTWTERVCLNVICHHRDGRPYSFEDLFKGTDPLYIRAYLKAAEYNLRLLNQQLQSGEATVSQYKITLDTLLGR